MNQNGKSSGNQSTDKKEKEEDDVEGTKGKMLVAHMGTQADSVESTLRASLITQARNQALEMLTADVTLRDYPDAVEDMKQYLAVAAVEGATVARERDPPGERGAGAQMVAIPA